MEEIKRQKAARVARAQKETELATQRYLEEQEELKKMREEQEAKKGTC